MYAIRSYYDDPGGTGLLSYLGTVHPQLAVAEAITRSASPVFVNVKIHPTFSPAFTLPKICSDDLKVSTGVPVVSAGVFLAAPLEFLPHDTVRHANAIIPAIINVSILPIFSYNFV